MPSGFPTCFFMIPAVLDTFDLSGEPVIMDALRPAHDCSHRRGVLCVLRRLPVIPLPFSSSREGYTNSFVHILASFVSRSSFVCAAAIAYLLETADAGIEYLIAVK